MGNRTGGVAQKGHQNKSIKDGDVYFIPEVAKVVIDRLKIHFPYMGTWTTKILDACANNGVLGQDIYPRLENAELTIQDIKHEGVSILDWKSDPFIKYDIIICNPPWKESLAVNIYHNLVNRLAVNGVLFFCINNVFMYQGWERAIMLKCQKYYFLPRYVFKFSGRPLLDCGIAVHHNGVIPGGACEQDSFIHMPSDIGPMPLFDYKPDVAGLLPTFE